ncbi:MAG: DUF2141 domain-containing protein [Alphaproteobacteria bacterium]|jgi:uncharacterized protein (DUF2141 family)|tara:strand:+ start:17997 stop:18467 length:471 start_codon:yes stop_codon:yes gene_type:complete
MLDFKVMHKLKNMLKIILIFYIFQSFLINKIYADHLKVIFNVNKSYQAEIIIEGYDRKYLFESRNAPLFIINKKLDDTDKPISIKSIPHIYIGLFAFIDINGDKKFSLDFKGNPSEPYGFSLNPKKNYQDIRYEDLVFDTSVTKEILEININLDDN